MLFDRGLGAIGLILLGTVPGLTVLAQASNFVLAQASNFGEMVISQAQLQAMASGSTAGLWALTNLARRDRYGNVCTGFADVNPDHTLILQDDFDQLTLQVDSGGNDTTLLVQGPTPEIIRCGEDSDRRNRDAHISDTGWLAGTYQIWVGAHHQGQRHSYSLTVGP
ncbi:MAG: hypothetical protein ACKO63_01295 [Nodosilinea sp.]